MAFRFLFKRKSRINAVECLNFFLEYGTMVKSVYDGEEI